MLESAQVTFAAEPMACVRGEVIDLADPVRTLAQAGSPPPDLWPPDGFDGDVFVVDWAGKVYRFLSRYEAQQ